MAEPNKFNEDRAKALLGLIDEDGIAKSAIDAGVNVHRETSKAEEIAATIGRIVGTVVGDQIGAKIGSIFGSPGKSVGRSIGRRVGGEAMESVARDIVNHIENRNPEQLPPEISEFSELPFEEDEVDAQNSAPDNSSTENDSEVQESDPGIAQDRALEKDGIYDDDGNRIDTSTPPGNQNTNGGNDGTLGDRAREKDGIFDGDGNRIDGGGGGGRNDSSGNDGTPGDRAREKDGLYDGDGNRNSTSAPPSKPDTGLRAGYPNGDLDPPAQNSNPSSNNSGGDRDNFGGNGNNSGGNDGSPGDRAREKDGIFDGDGNRIGGDRDRFGGSGYDSGGGGGDRDDNGHSGGNQSQTGGRVGASRPGDAGDGTRGGGSDGGRGGKPIVLDLDGDGVELVALEDSSAFYDIRGDGYRYNLGWAAADDGLLAYDKDDDGVIADQDEISFVGYVPEARTDLEGLRHFDSNNDGVLNADDAEFAKFRVWRDLDQNGESSASELRTLDEAGIRQIDLTYAPGDDGRIETRAGNRIFGEGRYHKTDGSFATFADLEFAVDSVGLRQNGHNLEFKSAGGNNKLYITPTGSAGVNIDFSQNDYAAHFGAQGSGHSDVLDGSAVSRGLLLLGEDGDDTLRGGSGDDWLVGGDGADTLEGGAGDDVLIFDGQDNVAGGAGFDLGFVAGSSGVTLDLHAKQLEGIYGSDGNDVFSTSGSSGVVLHGEGGNDRLTGSESADILAGGDGTDTLSGGAGDDLLVGGAGADNLDAGAGHDTLVADNTDTISGGDGWDTLIFSDNVAHNVDLAARGVERVFGGDGDDHFYIAQDVNSYSLHLFGGKGNDTLVGGVASDFLRGGQGNDTLKGGYRNDVYGFGLGDGRDTLYDDARVDEHQVNAGSDALRFGAGIRASDLLLQRKGEDLWIGLKQGGTTPTDLSTSNLANLIRIRDWNNLKNRIEAIEFVDGGRHNVTDLVRSAGVANNGAVVDLAIYAAIQVGSDAAEELSGGADQDWLYGLAGDDLLVGNAGDDQLLGGSGDDTLYGKSGNDRLFGGGGDDILSGYLGDDDLRGGAGDDTYMFYRGTGKDTIYDTGGGGDVLRFGWGIRVDDLLIQRKSGDLWIGLKQDATTPTDLSTSDLADLVRIRNWNNAANNRIEKLEFIDGGQLDITQVVRATRAVYTSEVVDLATYAGSIVGTEAGETLSGDTGRDWLYGLAGDDMLVGNAGDDQLFGGDGDDTLYGKSGNDRLFGGDGDDILSGYLGDDALYGGDGDDTYMFYRGTGKDTIDDSGGTGDALRLRKDIAKEDLWLSRDGADLVVSVLGETDQITVKRHFATPSSGNTRLEKIVLSDGQYLEEADLNNLVQSMARFSKPPDNWSALSQTDRNSMQAAINTAWTAASSA